MPPRAPALPPDERRRAIVEATLPLLREKGLTISTAEIARAACVAEGTLFRVFETKSDIIDAVIEHVMDPAPTIETLTTIPAHEPLEARVRRVVELWHARVAEISVLMAALHAGGESGHRHPSKSHHQHADHMSRLNEAVAGVLAPDADRLRLGVNETASLLRSLAFATAHPLLSDRLVTDPATLVDLFLHGALAGESSNSVHPEEPGPC
ncbi:TetR/AcrR family transcriptional regulator [Ammonicoccus fulvus]|uniref:TetR/AcrR family transcriptional regulator n=1 Tax=Ammonicoccus fulvus TaxID=3138240 RepID=A0ABZ3FJU0_9ACTN